MLNLLAVLAIVVVLAIAAFLFHRRSRSRYLEQRFGPEYERAVQELGSREKAEAELATRERRVSKLKIVPLQPGEADRFDQAWRSLQGRFVDDPRAVLVEADQLVRELMLARGYPMSDFERRAEDISVDHPRVVEHYRAAHAIAMRNRDGQADTEALRRAVVHYRALFDDLLEVRQPEPSRHEHEKVDS
jgi:hypothetical protein